MNTQAAPSFLAKFNNPSVRVGIIVVVAAVFGFLIVYNSVSELTKDQLLKVSAAAIVSAASLGMVLHHRSASISERIRTLVKELMEFEKVGALSERTKLRIECIERQIATFHDRYILNSWSLILLLVSFCCTVGLALSAIPGTPSPISLFSRILLVSISFLLTVSSATAVYEVCLGLSTMNEEASFGGKVSKQIKEKEDSLDPRAYDAVMYFNRLYHDVWFKARAELPQNGDRDAKLKVFYVRFFGMHQEQYYFYKNKLLPKFVYKQWIESLYSKCFVSNAGNIEDKSIDGVELAKGWQSVKASICDAEFAAYFDKLMNNKSGSWDVPQ